MTTSDPQQATDTQYDVPESAWVLALLFLGEQVVRLFAEGADTNNVFLISVPVSTLLVGWFSYGVLTARPVSGMIVLVLLWLGTIAMVLTLLSDPSIGHAAELAVTIGQVAALHAFRKTEYFAWQRTDPPNRSAGLEPLVWIALIVGVLGGILGASHDGVTFTMNF